MLSQADMGFSEVERALGIESGHLNYHLTALDHLITRNPEGKYQLSLFGRAALDLLANVEGTGRAFDGEGRPRAHILKPIRALLVVAVLLAGTSWALAVINPTLGSRTGTDSTYVVGSYFWREVDLSPNTVDDKAGVVTIAPGQNFTLLVQPNVTFLSLPPARDFLLVAEHKGPAYLDLGIRDYLILEDAYLQMYLTGTPVLNIYRDSKYASSVAHQNSTRFDLWKENITRSELRGVGVDFSESQSTVLAFNEIFHRNATVVELVNPSSTTAHVYWVVTYEYRVFAKSYASGALLETNVTKIIRFRDLLPDPLRDVNGTPSLSLLAVLDALIIISISLLALLLLTRTHRYAQ